MKADPMTPKQVNRQEAQVEARARVFRDAPPAEVLEYLMTQGFKPEQAADWMMQLYEERAKQVRARGDEKDFYWVRDDRCGRRWHLVCLPSCFIFSKS